jgi:hypothetical protein
MRISMCHDDPDYFPYAVESEVLLDGVRLSTCIMADEENGEVECYIKNDDGYGLKENPNYDKSKEYSKDNLPCIVEIKKGKVELAFNDEKYTREYCQTMLDNLKSGKWVLGV